MVLSKISLRAKLTLLIAPPIVALFVFAGQLLVDRWSQKVEAAELLEAVTIARAAAELVHESQGERGLTTATLGPGGDRFSSELLEQRARTDAKLQALRSAANSVHVAFAEIDETLASIERHVERLPQIRSSVDARSATNDAVMRYYTEVNRQLIELLRLVSVNASNAEIAQLAQVAYRFVQAKDGSGAERSTLVAAFSRGGFTDALHDRFEKIVALQDAHLDYFERSAPADARERWSDLQRRPFAAETARFRKVAADARTNGTRTSVEPEEWFAAQTAKISAMREVEQLVVKQVASLADDLASSASRQFTLGVMAVVITLAITAFLTLQIVKGIMQAVSVGIETAEGIARGRLDGRIDTNGNDEFSRLNVAMSNMQERLHSIVHRLLGGADEVLTSSVQLSGHGATLTKHTAEQASAVQELASSMEEIAATTQVSASNAEEAANLARKSAEQASEGSDIADRAMTAMTAIREDAKRIEDILDVINDIAFQTNILALNAAVEAARAGDQGRGFAVVAGEVQRLSERTTTSAKEVRALIEESRRAVEEGSGWVGKSVERLRTISEQAHGVNDLVTELASTFREQSVALTQINEVLGNIDVVAQQNAAMVEQMGGASLQVRDKAEETREILSFFETGTARVEDAGPSRKPPVALLTSNAPDDDWVDVDGHPEAHGSSETVS